MRPFNIQWPSLLSRSILSAAFIVCSVVGCLIAPASETIAADWTLDGIPIADARGPQSALVLSPDGAGGVYGAWVQSRPRVFLQPDTVQVYLSRLTSDGSSAPGWPIVGLAVHPVIDGQGRAFVASLASGDVQVGWNIFPGSESYPRGARTLRFHPWGMRVESWPEAGEALGRNDASLQELSVDIDDVTFAAWMETKANGDGDVAVQRIAFDTFPILTWGMHGTRVDSTMRDDLLPTIAPDDLGGVYVVWHVYLEGRVLARRIDGAGEFSAEWPGEAVSLGYNGAGIEGVSTSPDRSNGAYVAWSDAVYPYPDDQEGDIYLSRLVPQGGVSPAFPAGGLPVCRARLRQFTPRVSAVDGDAIVVWADYRDSVSYDIFAQRITPVGQVAPGWPVDGIPVVRAAGDQTEPVLVPDGSGGVLIAWRDQRTDLGDVYVQRLEASGVVASGWPEGGVRVCGAAGRQYGIVMASDGAGGAFVGWTDNRDPGASGVYLARVTSTGATGLDIPPAAVPPALRFIIAQPNPARSSQLVVFDVPATTSVTVEVYDVRGRRRRTIAMDQPFDPGRRGVTWDGRDDFGMALPSGVYLARVRTASATVTGKLVLVD